MKSGKEILDAALNREKQAHDFYDGLLVHCKVDGVRKLIERLRDEEAKHVAMIEAMMVQLRLGHSPK